MSSNGKANSIIPFLKITTFNIRSLGRPNTVKSSTSIKNINHLLSVSDIILLQETNNRKIQIDFLHHTFSDRCLILHNPLPGNSNTAGTTILVKLGLQTKFKISHEIVLKGYIQCILLSPLDQPHSLTSIINLYVDPLTKPQDLTLSVYWTKSNRSPLPYSGET